MQLPEISEDCLISCTGLYADINEDTYEREFERLAAGGLNYTQLLIFRIGQAFKKGSIWTDVFERLYQWGNSRA